MSAKPESLETRTGLGQLDLNVNASGKIELHQRVNRCGVGLHDIEQPLVGANFELLARLFVDVRSAVNAEFFDPRRERNGAPDQRAGAASSLGDFAGRLIEHPMIECLEANADILSFHVQQPMRKS